VGSIHRYADILSRRADGDEFSLLCRFYAASGIPVVAACAESRGAWPYVRVPARIGRHQRRVYGVAAALSSERRLACVDSAALLCPRVAGIIRRCTDVMLRRAILGLAVSACGARRGYSFVAAPSSGANSCLPARRRAGVVTGGGKFLPMSRCYAASGDSSVSRRFAVDSALMCKFYCN